MSVRMKPHCPVRRLIKHGYHHGDLRNALVNEGLKLLEQGGHANFTLRDLARRVGVSSAAPYAHFSDKDALLAAIATVGFNKLTEALEAAVRDQSDSREQFLRMGRAYVRFGIDQPALYKLMFASEELPAECGKYPELEAAAEASFAVLTAMLERMQGTLYLRSGNIDADGLTVWAHVHGLTSLIITGRVECVADPAPRPDDVVHASLMSLLTGLHAPGGAGNCG